MDEPRKLRVMIVNGVPLVRFGLAALAGCHPLLEVCAEAGDAREARRICAEEKPDLAVLDLEVPHGDGVELLRDFRKLHEPLRSLVVSEREDALSVQRAFRAGARGFVTAREEPAEVLAALDAVLAGRLYASRRVSLLLLEQMAGGSVAHSVAALSDRELQVFRLLGRGLRPTAIARDLGVSVKTVETHQQRMKEKLRAANGAELHRQAEHWVAKGARNGGIQKQGTAHAERRARAA